MYITCQETAQTARYYQRQRKATASAGTPATAISAAVSVSVPVSELLLTEKIRVEAKKVEISNNYIYAVFQNYHKFTFTLCIFANCNG